MCTLKGCVVRIKEWDNDVRRGRYPSDSRYLGDVVVIKEECHTGYALYYKIYGSDALWDYYDFAPLGRFRKQDLRNGMTVQMKDGDVYLVIDNMLIGENSFDSLDNYDNKLRNIDGFTDLDIVNVCDVYRGSDGFFIEDVLKKRGMVLTKELNGTRTFSFDDALAALREYYGCDVVITGDNNEHEFLHDDNR